MADRRQRSQKKNTKQPYRKEKNNKSRDEPVAVQISNLPSKNEAEIIEFLQKSIQFSTAKVCIFLPCLITLSKLLYQNTYMLTHEKLTRIDCMGKRRSSDYLQDYARS